MSLEGTQRPYELNVFELLTNMYVRYHSKYV